VENSSPTSQQDMPNTQTVTYPGVYLCGFANFVLFEKPWHIVSKKTEPQLPWHGQMHGPSKPALYRTALCIRHTGIVWFSWNKNIYIL